jgi:lysophospholipid acyltransferase (LPLAT)-like uncharacterized protein
MSENPITPSASQSRKAARKQGGVIVPHEPNFGQSVAARVIHLFISAISATVRYKLKSGENYLGSSVKRPSIFCVWHNRLALCLPIYWKYAQSASPTSGMAAMASASKDGAFLAAIIRCFKVHAVRGSSSRRGPQALLELTGWAERGHDLAITPDGPRGPCYTVQPGVISLAQVTGLPIVPCSYNLSRKITVKSWDQFQIPMPFSTCEVLIGKPITVPRNASDSEREQLRLELQTQLRSMTRE